MPPSRPLPSAIQGRGEGRSGSARLKSRATETVDELELRQRNAAIELARQDDYDYVVTNETGQVERTAARIDEIIAEVHGLHPARRISI